MRGCVLLCLVLACLVALTACRRGHRPHHRRPHHSSLASKGEMSIRRFNQGPHPPPCYEGLLEANTLFGVDLYKKLKSQSGNIILSPFSISAVLAMTYAGARGTTKSQMENALRFNAFPSYCNVDEGFKHLVQAFDATKHNHTLTVVNRVFVDSTLSLLSSYKNVTKFYYGAEAVVLPFSSMSSICRNVINAWVSSQTEGHIVDLLPKGSIDSITALVLVNAITFKGYWKHEFAGQTREEPFHQSKTTSVKMMHMGHDPERLRYADVSSLQAEVVELPFYNSTVAMYVVLPYKNFPLTYVEDQFSWNPNSLGLWYRRVKVSLPKFTAKKPTRLTAVLKALGINDLFARSTSNLTGIVHTEKPLWVGEMYHQAYINVHETGTKAGAATADGRTTLGIHPGRQTFIIDFVANRPFLFFVWDRQTYTLLFNGRFMG